MLNIYYLCYRIGLQHLLLLILNLLGRQLLLLQQNIFLSKLCCALVISIFSSQHHAAISLPTCGGKMDQQPFRKKSDGSWISSLLLGNNRQNMPVCAKMISFWVLGKESF